jgi:hypothetical protein
MVGILESNVHPVQQKSMTLTVLSYSNCVGMKPVA